MYIQKQGICFNCFHIAQWWDEPGEFLINGNPVVVCPNCGSYIECNPWKGSIVSAQTQDRIPPNETVLDLGKGKISFSDPITQEAVTLNDPSQIYTVLAAERRYIPEEQEEDSETNPVIHKIPDPALSTEAYDIIQNEFMKDHGINMSILIKVPSEDDEDETDHPDK